MRNIPIDTYHQHQLFCSIPTRLSPRGEERKPYMAELFMDPLTPKVYKKNMGSVFKAYKTGNRDLFYFCEYIPENKDGKQNTYIDTRSHDLVLGCKSGEEQAITYLAFKLLFDLSDGCALVVVPPSHMSKNGASGMHKLIEKMFYETAEHKGLIDGSHCLYRNENIPAAHLGGKRSLAMQKESISIRDIDLIRGKDVLLIDDVVTTGNSMAACEALLAPYARSVVCFAVGKTIRTENLQFGFILDLDGTLFDTATGPMEEARKQAMKTKDWSEVLTLARKVKPRRGAVELLQKIKASNSAYRIVTSAPGKYARILAETLGVDDSHLITYEDTLQHKPKVSPYMLAKAQMGLYDKMIIVIGDRDEKDMQPAVKLGMTGVLIGSSSKFPEVLSYPLIEDVVDHWKDITSGAEKTWHTLSSWYVKKNVSKENTSDSIYEGKVLRDIKEQYEDVPEIEPVTYLVALYNEKRVMRRDVKTYHEEILEQKDPIAVYEYYQTLIPVKKNNIEPMGFEEFCDNLYTLQREINEQKANGVKVIDSTHPDFPKAFKKAKDGPDYLFYKGDIKRLQERAVAIVSSTQLKNGISGQKARHFCELAYRCYWNIAIDLPSSRFLTTNWCDFDEDETNHGVCVAVSERPIYGVTEFTQTIQQNVLDNGGVVFSVALPSLMRNGTRMKEDAMKLLLTLGRGVFAFGYRDSRQKFVTITQKVYYDLIHDCKKPVGYYEFSSEELEESPYMEINNDLNFKYGYEPLSEDIDMYRFLAMLK